MTTKTANADIRLYIRCKDIETVRAFKRAAADFNTYEDFIKWIGKNYQTITKIIPPNPIHGGIL
jgi:hypothetical protein